MAEHIIGIQMEIRNLGNGFIFAVWCNSASLFGTDGRRPVRIRFGRWTAMRKIAVGLVLSLKFVYYNRQFLFQKGDCHATRTQTSSLDSQ